MVEKRITFQVGREAEKKNTEKETVILYLRIKMKSTDYCPGKMDKERVNNKE